MYEKVKHPPKNCLYCSAEFIPSRKDKTFCSRNCKKYNSRTINGRKYYFRIKPAAKLKKDFCECCGFKAVHRCQLDLDHIDGNHDNNDTTNLQTLCANCHRLKTWMNKDWENKKDAEDFSPTS